MEQIFSYGKYVEMPRFLFNCKHCGCEFGAQLEDMHSDRDGNYVVCPCCKKFIDWDFGKIMESYV